MNQQSKGFLQGSAFMAIIACLLWSTAFTGVKIGLNYMSPLLFAGVRFSISGILILLYYGKFKDYFKAVKIHFWYILLIALLQTVLMYGLFYTAMNMVPGSMGAMINGSGPLFAAIVAHLFIKDDKITLRSAGSILLGIIGIVIINIGRHTKGHVGGLEMIGVLLLIANNLVSGLYNVIVKKSKREISMLVLSSASLLIGGLLLILISIPFETMPTNLNFPAEFWLSLGWLSFLSAAAFALWFTLLKRPGVKISYLNSWKFIIPVFGAILSWLILPGESPDIYAVTGVIIIGASLLWMNNEALKHLFSKWLTKF
ncbi:MAG: DMT family transporter [Bacteroidales bacterium]|nr:DMT family transporter [Bacteroidales bacterium]